MPSRSYDLAFHLQKIKDSKVRSLYRNICKESKQKFSDILFTYNSDYTYLRLEQSNKYFARLYAQKSKMAIDTKGDYSQFPQFNTITQGRKFKDGKTINFHLYSSSSLEESMTLVTKAYLITGGSRLFESSKKSIDIGNESPISDTDASISFDELNLESIAKANESRYTSIRRRQGNVELRSVLLEAYHSQCALTGCDALEVLDAVYLVLDQEANDTKASSGLLLRTDIHLLFERYLLSIDPSSYEIVLSPNVSNSEYGYLEGNSLGLPDNEDDYPSSSALEKHFSKFMRMQD